LALSGHRPRVAEALAEAQALPSSPGAMMVKGVGGTFCFKTKGWKKNKATFKATTNIKNF